MSKPNTPINIQFTPDDYQLSISFAPPITYDTGPISDYEYKLNDGPAISVGNPNLPIIIPNLNNDSIYTVQIRSVNKVGKSEWSKPQDVPIGKLPGIPKIIEIQSSDKRLTVFFEKPDSNSKINGYEYTINNRNTIVSANTTDTQFVIPRLTNGKSYDVQIRAVNEIGNGEWSQPATAISGNIPTRPVITALEPADKRITVQFIPSAADRETPITKYEYRINDTRIVVANTIQNPITITGLPNGKEAKIEIRAFNMVGNSVWSNSKTETPGGFPDAPTIDDIIGSDQQLTVFFTPPIFNGGSPIIDYRYKLDNGPYVSANTTESPITIKGLKNGKKYSVRLRAFNRYGGNPEPLLSNTIESLTTIEGLKNESSLSVAADGTPAGPPYAPTITQIIPGDRSLTVYFTPGSPNGSTITGYSYQLNNENKYTPSGQTKSPIFISNLDNGNIYSVKIRATNSEGDGVESNSLEAVPYLLHNVNTPQPTAVVGYSPGDYFYTNVDFCSKTCNTNKNYCQRDTTTGILIATSETTYKLHQTVDASNACTANETYGTILKEMDSHLKITAQKYKRATEDYNRELLTTVNYLIGIGVLFGYIYVNNLLLPA